MTIVNGVETEAQRLSYDNIVKNTLAQSDELTIRFINGLFGDDIPLDASVDWLDKETHVRPFGCMLKPAVARR
jgi:hypothetical protein